MASIDERIVFEKTEFDYSNPEAQVVIVGITPGNSQLENSREGKSPREIKRENAFGGNMRPNLIKMLDFVGVNKVLGIESSQTLWEEDFDKVEMTSLLKEATYELNNNGGRDMFKNTKKIAKSQKLTQMLMEGFVEDCKHYTKARLFVALGPGVYEELNKLKDQGLISSPIIALAHPSGANSGRISCFLGTREPKDASYQWCMDMAEKAKEVIAGL